MANPEECGYKNATLRSEVIITQKGRLLIGKFACLVVSLTGAQVMVPHSKAHSGCDKKGITNATFLNLAL